MTDTERECVNAWMWAAIWWDATKERLDSETAKDLMFDDPYYLSQIARA